MGLLNFLLNMTSDFIPIAYAGSPTSSAVEKEVKGSQYATVFREGGKKVSMDGLYPYLVDGNSLEPEGFRNGSTIYVDKDVVASMEQLQLETFIGRFVVIAIDDERYRLEHPEKPIRIEGGFKVRKVLGFFDSNVQREGFNELMNGLIEKFNGSPYHNCVDDRHRFIESLYQKFDSARRYYRDEPKIMVFVTYKEGVYRDFSFHSPKYIVGVVRYVAN